MEKGEIFKISSAAGFIWTWVLAMEAYAKALNEIKPKRVKV